VYDADGTGTREIAAMVRMQAEAGVHNFTVLGFPYANACLGFPERTHEVGHICRQYSKFPIQ
jgi:hypothetical protein